jgi:hypothetical protein
MSLSDWAKANPDCFIHSLDTDQVILPTQTDDVPLPFELYTEEELEELEQQREQDDWIRSIPNPAERNPRLS